MKILSFFKHRRLRRAERLYDEARELVAGGRFEDALKFARKLRKVHYSGAFEIEGLAYAGSTETKTRCACFAKASRLRPKSG